MENAITKTELQDLGELLELIDCYGDSEQEAFLLLGRVYKTAKRAGYKAGLRDALAQRQKNDAHEEHTP